MFRSTASFCAVGAVRAKTLNRRRILRGVAVEDPVVEAGERGRAREHGVDDHTQGVLVRSKRRKISATLLWAHELRGSQQVPRPGESALRG